MNVVFIIKRTNEYKYYERLVNELIQNNFEVQLWYFCISSEKEKIKNYLVPSNLRLNCKSKLKKKIFFNRVDISNYIIKKTKEINFFISYDFIDARHFIFSELFFKSIKFKWCVIMHGMDSFVNLKYLNNKKIYLKDFYFFYSSKYMLNHGIKWLKKFYPTIVDLFLKNNKNFFEVGNLMLNNVFKSVTKKKKKLIYLPFPYLPSRYSQFKNFSFQAAYTGQFINYYDFFFKNNNNFFYSLYKDFVHKILHNFQILKNKKKVSKYFYHLNELKVIESIRSFCDKNNLEFIVKPRIKFPYIYRLNKIADRIVYDDESQQCPTLLHQELMDADLVVGSLSFAVFDTIFFNVPYINIEIPKIAFLEKDDKYWYNYSAGSYHNFNKVVYNFSIKKFITNFKKKKLDNFKIQKKNRLNYLKKFCGIKKNSNQSKKTINILKRLVK
jgi:hypothetical protein